MLAQAESLLSLDWRNVLAEIQGKPTSYECEHKNEIFQICSRCGLKHRIEAGENEQRDKKV